MDLLVHISASTTRKEDENHRAQALSYFDWHGATYLSLTSVGASPNLSGPEELVKVTLFDHGRLSCQTNLVQELDTVLEDTQLAVAAIVSQLSSSSQEGSSGRELQAAICSESTTTRQPGHFDHYNTPDRIDSLNSELPLSFGLGISSASLISGSVVQDKEAMLSSLPICTTRSVLKTDSYETGDVLDGRLSIVEEPLDNVRIAYAEELEHSAGQQQELAAVGRYHYEQHPAQNRPRDSELVIICTTRNGQMSDTSRATAEANPRLRHHRNSSLQFSTNSFSSLDLIRLCSKPRLQMNFASLAGAAGMDFECVQLDTKGWSVPKPCPQTGGDVPTLPATIGVPERRPPLKPICGHNQALHYGCRKRLRSSPLFPSVSPTRTRIFGNSKLSDNRREHTKENHLLFSSIEAGIKEFPHEIFSPPPRSHPGLLNAPTSQVTPMLLRLMENSDIKLRYNPILQKRPLRKMERGHWQLNTVNWSLSEQDRFWMFLTKLVSSGKCGMGTWCSRERGSCDGLGKVKVFCWGEIAPHMYLLMYAGSDGGIKGVSASWIDAVGQEIVRMK